MRGTEVPRGAAEALATDGRVGGFAATEGPALTGATGAALAAMGRGTGGAGGRSAGIDCGRDAARGSALAADGSASFFPPPSCRSANTATPSNKIAAAASPA